MFSAIKQLREAQENTLVLNAGDYYQVRIIFIIIIVKVAEQGTMWTSKLKYDPVVKFGNLLNWTAMGLGNHEFDLGFVDLAKFSRAVNFSLLACNLEENTNDVNKIIFEAFFAL